ncbi:unnamed protein product, partial [Candidula unifasciata]
ASCTQADIRKAKMCTDNLKNAFHTNSSAHSLISQIDENKVISACGNGDLLTAINCIERVVEQCKHANTDTAHYFLGMVDVEKARRTVNFFCTNVKVYTANAKCIADNHNEQNSCAAEAKKNFDTQAKATKNMDVLMRFQCIFFHEVVKCVDKVLTQKCSNEAADIVKTVLVGFEPPVCSTISGGSTAERAGTYDVQSDARYDNRNQASSCQLKLNVLLVLCSLISALKFLMF